MMIVTFEIRMVVGLVYVAEILLFYITCTLYGIFYYFSLDIESRKFRPEIL